MSPIETTTSTASNVPAADPTPAPLHVVFGAGQIGAGLARALRDRGLRVRVVRRSDRPVGEGIEVRAGDARDAAFAVAAAAGADVVYHCMNPSRYTGRVWARELPQLGEALLAAARVTGARLVVLDNLYAYGPRGGRIDEATPMAPVGRKGSVRKAWHERLMRAASEEAVRVVIARAGDFFGPGAEGAVVSEGSMRGLVAGKRPTVLGDPAAPHAFSYVPDVIAGLVALATATADVEGEVFHLPILEIAPGDLYQRVGAAAGVSVKPRRVGHTLFRLLSPVVPLAREMLETFYQWDRPFLVDDRRFRTRFPAVGASLDDAVAATAAVTRRPGATDPRDSAAA